MNNKKKIFAKIILISLLLIGAYLRIVRPDWDDGYYLHPDERLYINSSNIKMPSTISEFLSPASPLNPKMFYYGEFPLFMYVYSYRFLIKYISSINILELSRIISAVFSILTIPVIFRISKKLLPLKYSLLAALFFTFCSGSVQHAHFNTTESILVFFLSLIVLLSLNLIKSKKIFLHTVLISIIAGLSYATKITGLTFLIIPSVSYLYLLVARKHKIRTLFYGLIFLIILAIVGFLGSPYNVIDYRSFKIQQDFMQGVTYGKSKPPFVIIYEGTPAYFYFIYNILLYYFTPGLLLISLSGIIYMIYYAVKRKKIELIIFIIFPVLYFLWSGNWYAKFARYTVLFFPFLPISASYFLHLIERKTSIKWVLYLLIGFIVFGEASYAISFLNIYKNKNTRVEATYWIYENIKKGDVIAVEHWDDALPFPIPNKPFPQEAYKQVELTVYDTDTPDKISKLTQSVAGADYIVFSSRRVNFSIMKNPGLYPFTSLFYEKLFNNQLGFILEKEITRYPKIYGFLEINDNSADETIQSYDHPPVYVFRNVDRLTPIQIKDRVFEN